MGDVRYMTQAFEQHGGYVDRIDIIVNDQNLQRLPRRAIQDSMVRQLVRIEFTFHRRKLKKKTAQGILAVLLVGISLLFFLSYFLQGEVPEQIKTWLFNSFGLGAVILPVLMLIAGLMLTRLKIKFLQANLLLGLALILVSLVTLMAPLSTEAGGRVGLAIWENLSSVIGGPFSSLILILQTKS